MASQTVTRSILFLPLPTLLELSTSCLPKPSRPHSPPGSHSPPPTNKRRRPTSCPWLPTPGWYGCAQVWDTCQVVGYCVSMSFAFNKCQCPLLWLIPLGVKICLHSWWNHYSSISWDRIRTITCTNTLVLSNIELGGGVGAEGNVKSSSLSNFSRTQKAWSMHNCTSASSPHMLTIRIIALKEKFVPSTIASIKESP